jgi:hypothetical protein
MTMLLAGGRCIIAGRGAASIDMLIYLFHRDFGATNRAIEIVSPLGGSKDPTILVGREHTN